MKLTRLEVSGFHAGEGTLFTIKNGDDLIASGIATIVWENPTRARLNDSISVTVERTDSRLSVVGNCGKPPRIKWDGSLELTLDEIAILTAQPQRANAGEPLPTSDSTEEPQPQKK